MTAWELLPLLRDLFSRSPQYRYLEAWELQHVLWSLGYVEDLADEGEIEAARVVALLDRGEAA
jgi:hypothetical protein